MTKSIRITTTTTTVTRTNKQTNNQIENENLINLVVEIEKKFTFFLVSFFSTMISKIPLNNTHTHRHIQREKVTKENGILCNQKWKNL